MPQVFSSQTFQELVTPSAELVKRAIADKMTEQDLPEDLQEKIGLAREAANPKYTPASVADDLLSLWRSNRSDYDFSSLQLR